MKANKLGGILLLLVFVCLVTALLNENFAKPYNAGNLVRYTSMFAIIGMGAAFVIVTGGIDLSIGSVICLVGGTLTMSFNAWIDAPAADNLRFALWFLAFDLLALLLLWEVVPWTWSGIQLLRRSRWAKLVVFLAALAVFALAAMPTTICNQLYSLGFDASWVTFLSSALISLMLALHLGLLHGLLITKLNLQPFVVTLCGLMMYRGLTRWATNDSTQGFGSAYDESFRWLAIGEAMRLNTFLLVAGAVLLVVGVAGWLWMLIRSQRNLFGETGSQFLALSGCGLLLVVVGCVPWVTDTNEPAAASAGIAKMMGWWLVPIGFLIAWRYWVVGKGLRKTDSWWLWRLVLAGSLIVIGGTGLALVKLWLGERAVNVGKVSWQEFGVFLGVAVTAGVLLFGLFRLYRAINRHLQWTGQRLALLAATAACLVVIGWAALALTKHWVGEEGWKELESLLGVAATSGVLLFGLFSLYQAINLHLQWTGQCLTLLAATAACLVMLGNTELMGMRIPIPFVFMLGTLAVGMVLLKHTVFGRHLVALGRNETAAEYSGIDTDTTKIWAYVICSGCAGIGAILFSLELNSVDPSGFGSFYELYAIAAAVLGGCSLRGGEGSIAGVLIGAAVLRVLNNAPSMIGVPSRLEFFIIGLIILVGAIADEIAKRVAARRKLKAAENLLG